MGKRASTTNPSLRVVNPSVPPVIVTPGREPTNAELATQMVALGSAFDEHRKEDRKGFEQMIRKTNWQTFWISLITLAATIIGARL